jgi:hypothetical protein
MNATRNDTSKPQGKKYFNSKVKPGSVKVTFHKAYKYKPLQYEHIFKCFYNNRKFSKKTAINDV